MLEGDRYRCECILVGVGGGAVVGQGRAGVCGGLGDCHWRERALMGSGSAGGGSIGARMQRPPLRLFTATRLLLPCRCTSLGTR